MKLLSEIQLLQLEPGTCMFIAVPYNTAKNTAHVLQKTRHNVPSAHAGSMTRASADFENFEKGSLGYALTVLRKIY